VKAGLSVLALLPVSILQISICGFHSPVSAQPKLTLEQALALSLDSNRTYRVSVLEARSAREAVSWGRAGALPQVDASASYTETLNDTRQERINTPAESRNGAKSSNSSAGVTGTWTVFEGLSSLAAHDRLKSTADLANERREQTRQDIAAQVTLAYVGVVRERTVLAALDSSVALSRERVKLTQGKYGFGGASKLELLQSQLDLNEDLSGRLRQALVLGNAKRNLNLLLAREDTTSFDVEDSIALAEPPPFEGLRNAAIDGSPAIRQARLSQAVASAGLREYVGRLFPAVGLTLGYNYGLTESEVGLVRSNEALGLSYGVNVRMNLFDGFVLPADYRSARRSVARSRLLLDEVRDEVDASLSEAHASYRASLEILGLETSNLALARENMGIAMERLRLGTIAPLELREAQENFLSAETRLVSARFESKRAETELLRLAGRLARPNP
jgi:outer membrane protein